MPEYIVKECRLERVTRIYAVDAVSPQDAVNRVHNDFTLEYFDVEQESVDDEDQYYLVDGARLFGALSEENTP